MLNKENTYLFSKYITSISEILLGLIFLILEFFFLFKYSGIFSFLSSIGTIALVLIPVSFSFINILYKKTSSRILIFSVISVFSISILFLLFKIYQYNNGGKIINPFYMMVNFACAGFSFGGIIGHYQAKENEKLEELNKRSLQFKIISRIFRHNMRNKLSVLKGNIFLIDNNQEIKTSLKETTKDIQNISEKSYRMINTLNTDKTTVIHLNNKIENLIKDIEKNKTGDFSINIHHKTNGIKVKGCCINIENSIKELIENSIIHNDNVQIDIVIKRKFSHISVKICDNGTGIPENEITALKGNIHSISHSSGIGLWKAYWGIKKSGWDIDIENDKTGAVIKIQIPRDKEIINKSIF